MTQLAPKIQPITFMAMKDNPNWEYFVPNEDFEKIDVKGHRYCLKIRNGHLLPNLCRNLSVIKDMKVLPHDTFVVTYPKSGTNWVAELCWLINHDCDFEGANSNHHMTRASFIDMGWSEKLLDNMQSPRVFQTHLRLEFLPDNLQNRAKVVCVVRNPKDVLVSLFYFLQKLPQDQFDGTIEELFDEYVQGKVMYGAWWDHVNEFAQINNIHFVHFEDLLEDGLAEMRKLANFLDRGYLTDDQLNAIIDYCSFDKLKKSPAFDIKIPKEMIEQLKPRSGAPLDKPEVNIFRKGQIGDWKNHFSEEMSKKIDEIVANKLVYKKPFKYEPSK